MTYYYYFHSSIYLLFNFVYERILIFQLFNKRNTAILIKFTIKITFLFEVAATFLTERERVEKHNSVAKWLGITGTVSKWHAHCKFAFVFRMLSPGQDTPPSNYSSGNVVLQGAPCSQCRDLCPAGYVPHFWRWVPITHYHCMHFVRDVYIASSLLFNPYYLSL